MANTPEGREILGLSEIGNFTLKDIPEPSNCSFCQIPEQKEFLDIEWITERFVFRFALPGYGCTGCPLKSYEPGMLYKALEIAVQTSSLRGDVEGSGRFAKEVEMVLELYPNLRIK